jgi:hypothetical protein
MSTEFANADEAMNPDKYVLIKSVEGMLDLIQKQGALYKDTRKRWVDAHLHRPILTLSQGDTFYVPPSRDLRVLNEKMRAVGGRLRQLGSERENAKRLTEAAFKQLHDENEHLRCELKKLRQQILLSPE